MRMVFVVLYAVYGTALLFLAWRLDDHPIQLGVVGGLALACYVAAWQGWFNRGMVWKIIHTVFGVLTLMAWTAATGFVLLQIVGRGTTGEGGIGVILVGILAILLTPLAIAYIVAAVAWLRHRAAPRVTVTPMAGATPVAAAPMSAAPANATAPAGSASVATPPRSGARRRRRTVGIALGALGVIAVLSWMRFGSEIRCKQGDDPACYAAARAAEQRGDRGAALAFYDLLLDRQPKVDGPGWHAVPRGWNERNAILISERDYWRIDAAMIEACPQRQLPCSDLGDALDKAGERERAEAVYRRLCEQGGGEPCARFGKWLVDKGNEYAGMDLLRTKCDEGNVATCVEYGTQLARAKQFERAHEALKRACTLQRDATTAPRQRSQYAVCQSYIMQERAFATPAQLRADARDVCMTSLEHCPEVAGVIAHNANDPDAARDIVDEACAKHAATGSISGYAICNTTTGYMQRERPARR